MKNKISTQLKLIVEYLWLITAIASAGLAIYETYINSLKTAIPFYGFIFIALFFFTSRRNHRLKNQ